MTKTRRRFDVSDHYGPIGNPVTRTAPTTRDLFSTTSDDGDTDVSETSHAFRIARDIERLIPIAQELAAKAGASGITVSDLRITAVQRGILTGAEQGRQLAYLGTVLEKAGLCATQGYRRSVVTQSHGNLHRVFVAKEWAAA